MSALHQYDSILTNLGDYYHPHFTPGFTEHEKGKMILPTILQLLIRGRVGARAQPVCHGRSCTYLPALLPLMWVFLAEAGILGQPYIALLPLAFGISQLTYSIFNSVLVNCIGQSRPNCCNKQAGLKMQWLKHNRS